MKTAVLYSLITGALAVAIPPASAPAERDVDAISATDYSLGSWGASKKEKRDADVDAISATDYSLGSWGASKRDAAGNQKRSQLTAADVDDICPKLTASKEGVSGIPVEAFYALCSELLP